MPKATKMQSQKRKRSDSGYKRSVKQRKNGSTKRAGQITGLSRQDYGFPDRLKTRLQYCDVVQLAASAGTPALYQFRMNGLYDPDYTGTGHQPQWFDQLSAVYQTYRVLGSKITVTFIPNQVSDIEGNDKGPYICGITTHAGTSTLGAATHAALLEDANTVSGVIVDKQGANNKLTLSNTYSPTRDIGASKYDDTLYALTTNDLGVAKTLFASLWALDMTEAASQDVVAKVQIEYMVEFSQRRMNVNS